MAKGSPAKYRPSPQPSNKQDMDLPMSEAIETAFTLLYGREPSPHEVARLVEFGVLQAETTQQIMRRILAATDRQHLGSAFTIRFSEEDIRFVRLEDFDLAVDTSDVAVAGDMINRDAYEVHLTAFIKEHVKPGMRIVDVGANIGYFSILCSKLVGEHGQVLAFEPNTENARLLLISAAKNQCKNIELFPLALSPTRGKAIFTPYQGSNGGFVAGDIDRAILDPNCQIVPTMPLDEMVQKHVDLIKLDVEGAEGLVVAGATRIIKESRPIVTSEYSPEMLGRISGTTPTDYIFQFTSLGYEMLVLGRSGEANAVKDVMAFIRDYGAHTRIEDLAFVPKERL